MVRQMKKYVRQQMLTIDKRWTKAQKTKRIEAIYDVLEERDYSTKRIATMIAEVMVDRMNELKDLMDRNIWIYDEREKQK